MEIGAMLDELREKALKDRNIWQELMDTRKAEQPLAAFCAKCRELGYQIYEMDLITAGEEFYATMRRSTNGREKYEDTRVHCGISPERV